MTEFIVPMLEMTPHLKITWSKHDEMQEWCAKMFGAQAFSARELSETQRWGNRWHEGNIWWYFYRDEDASNFALRWL